MKPHLFPCLQHTTRPYMIAFSRVFRSRWPMCVRKGLLHLPDIALVLPGSRQEDEVCFAQACGRVEKAGRHYASIYTHLSPHCHCHSCARPPYLARSFSVWPRPSSHALPPGLASPHARGWLDRPTRLRAASGCGASSPRFSALQRTHAYSLFIYIYILLLLLHIHRSKHFRLAWGAGRALPHQDLLGACSCPGFASAEAPRTCGGDDHSPEGPAIHSFIHSFTHSLFQKQNKSTPSSLCLSFRFFSGESEQTKKEMSQLQLLTYNLQLGG